MNKLKPEGVCLYCHKTFTGTGISRHLTTHLKNIQKEKSTKKKAYHVKVNENNLYFLHLLIDERTTLEQIDHFLRAIWLECCGHLSSFEVKGGAPELQDFRSEDDFGLDMATKIGDFFEKGMPLNYQYDFGSTTYLELTVVNEYLINSKKKIVLLSRNEPLKILCHICEEKPAQVVCLQLHNEETVFCESCKTIHAKECSEFEYDEINMVNSPRTGICAYEGGSIDTERDGVWQG